MSNDIIQLYEDEEKKYPLTHEKAVFDSEGLLALEQVEKK